MVHGDQFNIDHGPANVQKVRDTVSLLLNGFSSRLRKWKQKMRWFQAVAQSSWGTLGHLCHLVKVWFQDKDEKVF